MPQRTPSISSPREHLPIKQNESPIDLQSVSQLPKETWAEKNQISLNSKHSLFDLKSASKGSYKCFWLPPPSFFFFSWTKVRQKELLRERENKKLFKGLRTSLSRDLNNLGRHYNTKLREESKTRLYSNLSSWILTTLGQIT